MPKEFWKSSLSFFMRIIYERVQVGTGTRCFRGNIAFINSFEERTGLILKFNKKNSIKETNTFLDRTYRADDTFQSSILVKWWYHILSRIPRKCKVKSIIRNFYLNSWLWEKFVNINFKVSKCFQIIQYESFLPLNYSKSGLKRKLSFAWIKNLFNTWSAFAIERNRVMCNFIFCLCFFCENSSNLSNWRGVQLTRLNWMTKVWKPHISIFWTFSDLINHIL